MYWFIKADNEHKRFMIRTWINFLMARIGKNNQYDYVMLKLIKDLFPTKLVTESEPRNIPLNKVLPFDITHNLICPKCKIRFFDMTGKSKLVDIRKSVCPFCCYLFDGLDRSHWCMKSEDLKEHITVIEGMKKSMFEGWKPPPVDLYCDDNTGMHYKIGDGFKRMITHIDLGKEYVLAFVFHKESSTPSSRTS